MGPRCCCCNPLGKHLEVSSGEDGPAAAAGSLLSEAETGQAHPRRTHPRKLSGTRFLWKALGMSGTNGKHT